MNQEQNDYKIQRILAALDSSPASLAALDAAVELAAGFGARIEGVFIEDARLIRLAELSITQEIGLFSAVSRRLEVRTVRRQFRGRARQTRQLLEKAARQAGVPWSFRVARGDIAAELLVAASKTDLVILGKVGWSPLSRKRLGSTSRALLSRGTKLTLILPHGAPLKPPALVVYNGSVVSQKSLALAARLIQPVNGRLAVLILAESADTARRLQNEATAWLEDRDLTAGYMWRAKTTAQDLSDIVALEKCHMLILPGNSLLLEDETELLSLLDELECAVLLTR